MNQIQSKSILAKCLATEDISIVHDAKMPTAAFDVKARTLYLPQWKDMSPELYDLFIGHEVGHAHETPAEGWHDAVCDDVKKKNFLNVVEDVRIERKIKGRYPGLVSRFYKGYKELVDGDFFGIKGIDINKLPLIDRVNLHYKVGHMMGVNFTTEEQDLVSRIGKAETWKDVERLADELFAANKKDVEDKKDELESMIDKMMPQRFKQDPNGEEQQEGEGQESSSGDEEEGDEEETDSFGGSASDDDETEEEQEAREEAEQQAKQDQRDKDYEEWLNKTPEERKAEEEAKEKAQEQFKKDQELKKQLDKLQEALDNEGSVTDNAFRENEQSLVDQNAHDVIYVTAPDINPEEFIVPMNKLYNWDKSISLQTAAKIGDHFENVTLANDKVYEVATKLYDKWNRTQTPIINSMAQQFELKKAATAYKKASIAKMGKLNEDKLWAYKLTDDLFQRAMIVPNGKNHGILMFVDLSGSMYRHMSGTVDQLMNVAAFCRKVNIPFDAYGFSTASRSDRDGEQNWYAKHKEELKTLAEGTMSIDDPSFSLVHMLSSKCSKNEHINAMKYLSVMKCGWDDRRYYDDYESGETWGYIENPYFCLSSTPLNSTIIVGQKIAKIFRKKYNVEILSTIFLTDGGATDSLNYVTHLDYHKEEREEPCVRGLYNETPAIKDGSSTTVLDQSPDRYNRREMATPALLEWYKLSTGSRMINFHIVDGKKNQFWEEFNKNNWMEKGDEPHTSYRPSYEWNDTEWKDCNKNKFMVVEDRYGFEQRFLIKGKDALKIQDQELNVRSSNKGDLMRGFRAFNKGKTNQRLFLNKIIELVA